MTLEERRATIARRDPEKRRAADRARYERHRETRLAAMAERRPRYTGKRATAYWQAWAERYPEKAEAHRLVSNAVQAGRLTRQVCETCGRLPSEAHHDDYSKPLDVRWLCRTHHLEHHAREREMQRMATVG